MCMASAIASLKKEWHRFREDEPGKRFDNHRRRVEQRSRAHAALSLVMAVVLLVVGFVLLFVPGPGLPLIVFGLALLATHSERLSRLLDRAEPPIRDVAHRAARRWKGMPRAARTGLIASAVVVASVFLLASYQVAAALLH